MWYILFCRFTSICAGARLCVNHWPSCLVQAPSDWTWCVCHAGVWPHQSDRGPADASSVPPIACDTQTAGKEKPRRRRQQRRWLCPHATTFLLPGVRRSGERTARCPGRLPGRCGWWRCGRQVRPVRFFSFVEASDDRFCWSPLSVKLPVQLVFQLAISASYVSQACFC